MKRHKAQTSERLSLDTTQELVLRAQVVQNSRYSSLSFTAGADRSVADGSNTKEVSISDRN